MPYGNVNVDTVTTSTTGGVLGAGNASIMKNRVINGAMTISQSAAGATITPVTSTAIATNYPVDRFFIAVSQNSKLTTAQANADGLALAAGFNKCLNVTVTSAYTVGSGEVFVLQQRIEGYNVSDLVFGTASAKTVTLSFWVKSSLTGTFGGSIMGASGTRAYPFTYTISAANTWEQKSITITGCTDGTWVTTNGNGLLLAWSLGTGSSLTTTANAWANGEYYNATGAQSIVATNGATWNITGVQLEVGSSATGFEYVNYQTSLANCQRYYAKMSSAVTYAGYGAGYNSSTSQANFYIKYPTTMRSAPTINQNNLLIITGTGVSVSGIGSTYAGTDAATIAANASSSTLTTYQGAVLSQNSGGSGYLDFSAEL